MRPTVVVIWLALALILAATAGCRAPVLIDRRTASAPVSAAGSVVARVRLDRLLAELTTAVDRRDRTGLDRLLSDRDPGFPATAGMILDNLDRLHPTAFGLRPTGRTRELGPRRRSLLGAGSYAAQVQVSWAVPGDRSPSSQTVWMTISAGRPGAGTPAWAGIADGPDRPAPTPLWWLEPIRIARNRVATVITGAQVDPAPWLARATTAALTSAGRLHPGRTGPAARWNGRLVVVAPSNEALLESTLGVARGAEAALAAITWPDGDPVSSAPIRILINPARTGSDLADRIVLSHESVHVATASPVSAVPRWLIEGFADELAYQQYPRASRPAATELLRQVRRSGPPDRLPPVSAFDSGGTALNRTYAQAWSACHYLAARSGTGRLLHFYGLVAATPGGTIGPALHSVYGLGPQAFLTGWQDYLRRAAAHGQV